MIPVANIYYLLLYAWKHAQRDEQVPVSVEAHTELHNLFGDVLATEAARLLARGLAREYVTESVVIGGVRGKLDVGATVKRQLLANAKTQCAVDELRHDILRNQLIKAAVRRLLLVEALNGDVAERLRRVYQKIDDVSDIAPTALHFRSVQSHRLARGYSLALSVSRLVFEQTMVDTSRGVAVFQDFRRKKAIMWKLFEDFLFQFYSVEQEHYNVRRQQVAWFDVSATEHDLARLPIMQTDIVLESGERCLIMDAKFYKKALGGRMGGERVKSSHIYQLMSYLENRAAHHPDVPHDGILIYPVVEAPFSFSYRIRGHRLLIRSIDLMRPWKEIHDSLLEYIRIPAAA